MTPIDLTPIYQQDEGKWAALSEDYQTVYGSGKSVQETVDAAKAEGHQDFTLLFVEPTDTLCVGGPR